MRKEAVWAVSNILYRVSDPAVIEHLVSIDIVNVIVERLQRDSDSGSISSLSLQSVDYLLQKSQTARTIFDHFGGEGIVQDMQLS
jgi:hypothetical protein